MRSFFMKLFFRKIFFCQSDGSSGKKEDTDQVRDCHKSVEGLGDAPHQSEVPQPMIVEKAKQHMATAVKTDIQFP